MESERATESLADSRNPSFSPTEMPISVGEKV